MAGREYEFQPGSVLHAAILGAFRGNNSTFAAWCRDNDVTEAVARQATHGQAGGQSGTDILGRMIAAAGEEYVRQIYEVRLLMHADEVRIARRERLMREVAE